MPSVLTELGFITTPKEERYLNSQQGIGELSRSIYNGFLAYRRIHEKGARDIPANLPLQVQADEHPNLSVLPPDRSGGGSKGNNEVAVVPVKTVSTAELMQERQGRDEAANTVTAPARARQELRIAAQDGDLLAENEAAANARNKADKTSAPAKAKTDTPNQKAAKPKAKTEKPRADRVIYRIQVGAGKRAIPAGDRQFKGVTISREKEGELYKYYHGKYDAYSQAQRELKTVKQKLEHAYIVAFIGNKAVSVSEARAKEHK